MVRNYCLVLLLAGMSAAIASQDAPKKIHVIGASVSGGFEDGPFLGAKQAGDSISLHYMLKKWCDGEAKVTAHPSVEMCYMFNNPAKVGRKQIEYAKKRTPDIVLAVDFAFWFAYGWVRAPDKAKVRLAELEKCLLMIKELDAHVIIGDIPDMTGAARRILRPSWIPSEESLRRLNARLEKFAKDHANVTLVHLGAIVKDHRAGGINLPLREGSIRTPPGALMQEDRLHLTRLGVSMLMLQLQDPLRSCFPKSHVVRARKWSFEALVEAAGAEDELETLRAAVGK